MGIAPQAVLLSPSAQSSAPDVDTLESYLSLPGVVAATGVISSHNYTYGNGCCAAAEALSGQWKVLQSLLPAPAPGIPVWSTEGSWGDTASKEPDPDIQSAYVARAYLLGWALGYRRMYWYAWGNSWGRLWSQSGVNNCSDQGTGSGCLSAAAGAYATVYSWMVGRKMTNPCNPRGTIYTCELTSTAGSKSLAVWDAALSCVNGLCARSAFNVPAGYSSYVDLANVRRSLKGKILWIGPKPLLLLPDNRASSSGAAR